MSQFQITIGLDRNGTINEDNGDIAHPNAFVPIPKSLEAVAQIRAKGYNIVILTNQPGISKGIMTPDDVDAVNNHMLQLLGEAGCPSIDAIYYSTTNMKSDIFAKPNVGMFKRAEKEQGVKFKGGAYVGDKMSDLKAAMKIGAQPVLVRTGYGLTTEQDLNKYAYRDIKAKVAVFDTLWDFAQALPWNE